MEERRRGDNSETGPAHHNTKTLDLIFTHNLYFTRHHANTHSPQATGSDECDQSTNALSSTNPSHGASQRGCVNGQRYLGSHSDLSPPGGVMIAPVVIKLLQSTASASSGRFTQPALKEINPWRNISTVAAAEVMTGCGSWVRLVCFRLCVQC